MKVPQEDEEETITLMPEDKINTSSDPRLPEEDRFPLAARRAGSVTQLSRRLQLLCGFNKVHSRDARPGAEKKQARQSGVLGPNLVLLLTGCEFKRSPLFPTLSFNLLLC